MRKDTLLIVLGFAVVAAATYFILDATLTHPHPQLAPVVSDKPQVVDEKVAANSEKAEEVADAGLTPAQQVEADKKKKTADAQSPEAADSPSNDSADEDSNDLTGKESGNADSGDAEADEQTTDSGVSAQAAPAAQDNASEPASDDTDATESSADTPSDAATTEESADAATDDSTAPAEDNEAPSDSDNDQASASKPEELIARTTVNVRKQGNKQAAVVGKLTPGEHVSVVSSADGDWVEIKNKDTQGWVFHTLVKKPAQ